MDIGILGTGNMAETLGRHWLRAGHRIFIGGRDLTRANALAARLGGDTRAGTLAEAGQFGSVVLVAVAAPGALDAVRAAGDLAGRVVLDCTNPIDPDNGFALLTEGGPAMAERIAAVATGAEVVKAFNLCSAELWQAGESVVDGREVLVPFAASGSAAAAVARRLISDAGFLGLELPGLRWAGQLEALASIGIRLLVAGIGLESVLPFAQPGPPPDEPVSQSVSAAS